MQNSTEMGFWCKETGQQTENERYVEYHISVKGAEENQMDIIKCRERTLLETRNSRSNVHVKIDLERLDRQTSGKKTFDSPNKSFLNLIYCVYNLPTLAIKLLDIVFSNIFTIKI